MSPTTAVRSDKTMPPVTLLLIAVNIVVYGLELTAAPARQPMDSFLRQWAVSSDSMSKPWTLVTSMFLHDPYSSAHIAFNMMALASVGVVLEKAIGGIAYSCLYFAGGVCGSLVAWWWTATTGSQEVHLGASGAIFSLFSACLVLAGRLGVDWKSLAGCLALNLAVPIVTPGVSWQAHTGGAVLGALAGVAAMLASRTAEYDGTWPVRLSRPGRFMLSSSSIALAVVAFLLSSTIL